MVTKHVQLSALQADRIALPGLLVAGWGHEMTFSQ